MEATIPYEANRFWYYDLWLDLLQRERIIGQRGLLEKSS